MERLNNRYVIERRLGRGGMGEVFAGRALGLEGFSHPVAIKRLAERLRDDPEHRAMLIAEARLVSRLAHSNIVAVHDLDQDDAGQLFLVMELVAGTDLAGLLRTGALPLPVALYVAAECLRGLGHAHEFPHTADSVCGLVHRDVTPHNILIGEDGAVKVSDFGLAKARTDEQISASLLVKGKLAYLSPEQAQSHPLDGRSDLFAVGAVLWEMICGERLFDHSTMPAIGRSLLLDPIPSPRSRVPDLPRDVERVTMRLLEREPSGRYAAARTAIDALLACAAYPKNGPELLVALLRERLGSSASWSEETSSELTLAAPVRREPYPDPPIFVRLLVGRARLLVKAASLMVATAIVAFLVLRWMRRDDDAPTSPRGPAAQTAQRIPPVESPAASPASSALVAPSQPSTNPVSPLPAAPTVPAAPTAPAAPTVPAAPAVAPSPSRARRPARRNPASDASAPAVPAPAAPPVNDMAFDLRKFPDWPSPGSAAETGSPNP